MRCRASIAAKFDRANRQAAEIIVADPGRYPGVTQVWAEAVLQRLENAEAGQNAN
ncbi:MAG: hypothetical protein P4L40_09810 [Terracidiphilus sp.]|nr:hypothetical protein [Terracidiphilus sp.]